VRLRHHGTTCNLRGLTAPSVHHFLKCLLNNRRCVTNRNQYGPLNGVTVAEIGVSCSYFTDWKDQFLSCQGNFLFFRLHAFTDLSCSVYRLSRVKKTLHTGSLLNRAACTKQKFWPVEQRRWCFYPESLIFAYSRDIIKKLISSSTDFPSFTESMAHCNVHKFPPWIMFRSTRMHSIPFLRI
jgi:hypothetical protein